MINFPELAKPTSSMESLQPIKFGSTQSYLWKPGYHIYQSGDITKFFSCTRTHRIRRILEEIIKHTQSHLWKDWTILRFNHYQPNQLRPEDILTKPRHPEEIIGDQEEFCKFIPCTGQHRIMGSSLTPTCLIWSFLHSNSNSSFSLSLCTTSSPSKPSRRSQGSSLIPLDLPDSIVRCWEKL
uniref:Uncharacterized protein n=1 Tax=Brassica oleracea TaxID=3712 RepID=A0A3P6E6F6_BRAOL|nr:unnamed protein product [Brassica oleracea]